MLRKIGYDSELMFKIIQHSHERFNGSGSGDEIPLGSRILAMADAYSALTSWRPYHEKMDREAALDELENDAEKGKYDSQVFKALRALMG